MCVTEAHGGTRGVFEGSGEKSEFYVHGPIASKGGTRVFRMVWGNQDFILMRCCNQAK